MTLRRCQTISVIAVMTCASLHANSPLPRKGTTVVTCDLEGDHKQERIVLDPRHNPTVSIWRGDKRLWQGIPQKWKPWKLMTADVEGDGKLEIILGIHKTTRFFPKPHNCLFVYGWDGKQAFPKWLGSSLSKPFTDFTFGDLDGDHRDRLISIETQRDGKQCVAVYSWNGFGFTHEWERGSWKKVRLIRVIKSAIIVEADGERILIKR